MEQNNASAAAQRGDLVYSATTETEPAGKVGKAYLKFMIGTLVAFMLLIVGKIESADLTNRSAGRVILLLALVAALFAVFELSRAIIAGKARPRAADTID